VLQRRGEEGTYEKEDKESESPHPASGRKRESRVEGSEDERERSASRALLLGPLPPTSLPTSYSELPLLDRMTIHSQDPQLLTQKSLQAGQPIPHHLPPLPTALSVQLQASEEEEDQPREEEQR